MPPAPATVEVLAGETAALNCNSIDQNHNFQFWQLNGDQIVGPDDVFNESKYKYEVLSGKLHIRNVTPSEAGIYKCVSKGLSDEEHVVGKTYLTVDHEADTPFDAIKLLAIIVSILVIVTCLVIYFRLKRDWDKYDGRIILPAEDFDEEEEEDRDEVYNKTTTLKNPVPGPSRNTSSDHLYGIDNHGLDTDFNSVFEQIQIKTPERSLI